MLRYALLLCGGVLAIMGIACTPEAQDAFHRGAAPQPPSPTLACDLGSKVLVLKPINYNPNASSYSRPDYQNNIQVGYQLRDEIKQDLNNALALAPPTIQRQLCGVTAILIDSTGCPSGDVNDCVNPTGGYFDNSWGFRSTHGGDKGNTYLAISGRLWYLGKPYHAVDLATYEDGFLGEFAKWLGRPSIASATPNDPSLTVLAALAHELGHIRWAQTVIPSGAGNNYKFDRLTNCSLPGGLAVNFFSYWDYGGKDKKLRPPNRWRGFGKILNDESTSTTDKYTEHLNPPLISQLKTNQAISALYQPDQPWPSLFGARTPDEDFIETYVMYALLGNKLDNPQYMGSYLQSLKIDIPGYQQADIPADLLAGNKPLLLTKIRCIAGLP